jgi:hypothetical protein
VYIVTPFISLHSNEILAGKSGFTKYSSATFKTRIFLNNNLKNCAIIIISLSLYNKISLGEKACFEMHQFSL